MLSRMIILLIALSLSFAWSFYRTKQLSQWHLPEKFIKKPVLVEGQVISIPKTNYSSAHFKFQLTKLAGKQQSTRLALTWYRPYPILKVGDTWRFFVKLKPPHGLRNPGGFDYEHWLMTQGIRATGYIDHHKKAQKIRHDNGIHPIDQIRQSVQSIVQDSISDQSLAAVINTLTIGSKSLLDSKQWRVFQNTGTSHLMAISGLHVGLIASVVYYISRFIWSLFPWLLLRIPAPRAASMVTILMVILYGLLVGFSLPTQRAVIMIVILMLASLLYQYVPVWRRLLLAFFIIVIWDPFALFSSSFWLSFMAVFLIGYTMGGRLSKNRGVTSWLRLQCVIFLGLLPITLFYFQQFSLVSLIANFPAITWVGMIIVPLCLLATVVCLFSIALGHWIFWLTAKLLMPLWWWLNWLASWPHVIWYHAVINHWILLSSLVAVFLLLAPKGWPGRWLGLIWALPLFFYRVPGPDLGGIDFILLDVGQGLSTVIRTTHHTLVYDAGPRSYAGFDAGERVITPYLRSQGISKLDLLMISHGDNDHMGGANAIISNFPVERILTSVPRRFHRSTARYCYSGQHWRWDGVDFKVLSPPKGEAYQGNNSSCVLKISNGVRSILLSGDIEKERETWLIKNKKVRLASDILVAPHHGSKTSSSWDWVNQVGVKDVLFAVGYYNQYGFPNPVVVNRYRSVGARLFTTANEGAIQIHIDPDGQIKIKAARGKLHGE